MQFNSKDKLLKKNKTVKKRYKTSFYTDAVTFPGVWRLDLHHHQPI